MNKIWEERERLSQIKKRGKKKRKEKRKGKLIDGPPLLPRGAPCFLFPMALFKRVGRLPRSENTKLPLTY